MKLISKKSCIVLLIFIMSSIADYNKWSDKVKIARRIKRINQKLHKFKEVVISSRESCETAMYNGCEKMSWGNELSLYKEDGCDQIEKSFYLYSIVFIGMVLIILIFYFHNVYPKYYLYDFEDLQLWHNVSFAEENMV